MKIKSGFLLHEMGDEYVVVPIEERTMEFHGMIRLNGTGAFLWKQMQSAFTKESLTAALLDTYEVDEETAAHTAEAFVRKLWNAGVVEE